MTQPLALTVPNIVARHERLAGIALIVTAGAALVLANSPLAEFYDDILHAPLGPLSVHYWIADALMAVFFLLVGLEVKREWVDGQLASRTTRVLPMIAAVAGMIVPALIYLLVVGFDTEMARGWAIPAATDIAFALGILALIGAGAPPGIKLLLVTIAIIDDIGAVAIIAIFYTAELHWGSVAISAAIVASLFGLNRIGVRKLWPYLLGFLLLWAAVFQSGVHATVAGVLTALTVPLGVGERSSPLKRLEHLIHPWVMFGVVPLFGLASAGVAIGGLDSIIAPVPLGVATGLFLGKQIGIFGAIWAAHRLGVACKPAQLNWSHIHVVALLCGIGFTMSLFIGDLAFTDEDLVEAAKIGTLAGSALAAVLAIGILRTARAPTIPQGDQEQASDVFGGNFEVDPQVDGSAARAGPKD